MYGANLPWVNFGGDFGGIGPWRQLGASRNSATETAVATAAEGGASVIRWWVWPDLRGDGVVFDDNEMPASLGGNAEADVRAALEIAEKHDVYLMLTLFSFDGFRPTRAESSGVTIRSLRPMVVEEGSREALLENVVRPFARAAGNSPLARRLIAWDVINEPEWAMSGASLHGGDPAFEPSSDLEPVSHAEMEQFISEVIEVLSDETQALVTVGAAAMKWKNAWSQLGLDFYQFHIYDWIDRWWPYTSSPEAYGILDKPVVMGEFDPAGIGGDDYTTVLESWFSNGYAGALAWQDHSFEIDWAEVKAFADAHACETRY
jgi:hypothetical protein